MSITTHTNPGTAVQVNPASAKATSSFEDGPHFEVVSLVSVKQQYCELGKIYNLCVPPAASTSNLLVTAHPRNREALT